MGVFYVFKLYKMVTNRASHIWYTGMSYIDIYHYHFNLSKFRLANDNAIYFILHFQYCTMWPVNYSLITLINLTTIMIT